MNPESMDTEQVETGNIPERGTVDVKVTCWHTFEVVFGKDTFLRYCKECGKSSFITQLEHYPSRWTDIIEEGEE